MTYDNILYINTASMAQATVTSLTATNTIVGTTQQSLWSTQSLFATQSLFSTQSLYATQSLNATSSISASYASTASLLLGSISSASYATTASYYKITPAIKSGQIASQSFGGIPLTASVTFATAYASVNYSISVIGGDNRAWTAEYVSASNFIVSSNSIQPLTNTVYWITMATGESS